MDEEMKKLSLIIVPKIIKMMKKMMMIPIIIKLLRSQPCGNIAKTMISRN